MNLSLPATKFPAARTFLLFWLQRTITRVAYQQNLILPIPLAYEPSFITRKSDLHTSRLTKKCSQTRENLVTKGSLLLTKVKENTRTLYICPIAFQLSQSWETSPIDIATQIADRFSYLSSQELSANPKKYFALKVVPPGWLHLQLTDLGIVTWLQSLAEEQENLLTQNSSTSSPSSSQSPVPSPQSQVFSVQYVHARCCSLLRLAAREGTWGGAIAPEAIPWLNEKGELRLTHPAEGNLISQLLSALDTLYCPESSKNPSWEKFASEISLSWEKFYSQCRIWGEVKTETPELAQARLGLLLATQTMLQMLLEEGLGIPAPGEL
ncbi:DALR anticodon-binding domain-containing protein [Aerosakkonemataceae cyanobacterium BLCC-F154]|uniref:DALR anticodon-binding domain-containing protein n=1 Tax=Floridaenema fluviatile BLCC-F154 TaxID=3153640 RepID=A0ABV4YDF4_9CYAN